MFTQWRWCALFPRFIVIPFLSAEWWRVFSPLLQAFCPRTNSRPDLLIYRTVLCYQTPCAHDASPQGNRKLEDC
ncbi:hypothetical protein IW261DRAFT_1504614, partial [Armillaria novae-zelandiae]